MLFRSGYGDITDWASQGTFTTLCPAQSIPLTEGFEATTFPECWTRKMTATGDWGTSTPTSTLTPYRYTSTKHDGTGAMSISGYYYNGTSFTSPRVTCATVASPEVLVADIAPIEIEFWAYCSNKNYILNVGVMTDPNDEVTFQELAAVKVAATSTWEKFIVPLSNATAGKFVAFRVDGANIVTTSTYSVTATFYVDDITIRTQPTCPTPQLFERLNYTTNSLEVKWASYNATSWQMKVSTTPMTDMTLNGDVFNGTVNSNTYTLTNLTANTKYYIYVRANCNDGETS